MNSTKLSLGKNSLARQALIGMALRIMVVIFIATGVSYWYMQRSLHSSILQNLSNYADMRGKAESEQFLLAERQSEMLRDEFLLRLQAMGDYDPKAEFEKIFVREADGLIRVRPEINDYRHHATAYLRHDVPLTPDLRRRFYIGWQLLDQWGPLLTNRFFSGFMNMPEQLSINFCPTADWGRSATRDLDITIYETVWRSTIEKNPERLPFWTTVYYDPGADAWMVSRVTPGDYQGRWVVTGGQDVEISDLISRTTSNPIMEGTWNFIFDERGNLIAHPNLTEQIAMAGGNLQIDQLGDQDLAEMVRAVLSKDNGEAHTLELPDLDALLGVTRIDGPGWYFVTVYPKQLMKEQALSTAYIFLALGFGTLLLELGIMAIILRRRIAMPIANVVSATEQISHGDFSVRLGPQDNYELGLLASSVNRMAEAVDEHYEALRRSKELLSLFIHHSPIYAFIKEVTPTESRVLHVSDNFQEMIGISGADMVGKSMEDLFQPEFAAKITADDWAVVTGGEVLRLDEDLNGRNYTTIKFPIVQGGKTLLAGYTIDITERKKAKDELEGLNKELEQILYAATHDLKSPLVNIYGYTGELKRTFDEITKVMEGSEISPELRGEISKLAKELPESFHFINRSVSRMDALLNGLLQFSRSGKVELKKEDIDMNMLISEISAGFNYKLKDTGASLKVMDLPRCTGDRGEIGRVFSNLIENAVKYLDPARKGEINISGYIEGDLSVYCIEDNGIGMAVEHQGQIFHIFHQLDPAVTGEGLGLAIVQRIVERHGGKIWLESERGKGSRFYVGLPGAKT